MNKKDLLNLIEVLDNVEKILDQLIEKVLDASKSKNQLIPKPIPVKSNRKFSL